MLRTNYHMHTTFDDGKNTIEEMTEAAIAKGFDAIGFSGHGFTEFDQRYCMKDPAGFIRAVKQAQKTYADRIQIYLGSEEDIFRPVPRGEYQYLISSSHYFHIGDRYYPIDSSPQYFAQCLAAFGGDPMKLAESYFSTFVPYIRKRKPDIVGHFDLITKFDEQNHQYLENESYRKLAREALTEALLSDSYFEVNTGAISRGYRSLPYPSEDLLYTLKKEGGKVILSSDSHAAGTIDCYFEEARSMLKDIGFQYIYALYNGEFVKDKL